MNSKLPYSVQAHSRHGPDIMQAAGTKADRTEPASACSRIILHVAHLSHTFFQSQINLSLRSSQHISSDTSTNCCHRKHPKDTSAAPIGQRTKTALISALVRFSNIVCFPNAMLYERPPKKRLRLMQVLRCRVCRATGSHGVLVAQQWCQFYAVLACRISKVVITT